MKKDLGAVIFPSTCRASGESVVVIARVLLALGVFGAAFAMLVNIVRLLAGAVGDHTQPRRPVPR